MYEESPIIPATGEPARCVIRRVDDEWVFRHEPAT
jgi:hypothetical protein